MLTRVVLPAPFGPMRACTLPASRASETSASALTPPKALASPEAVRIGRCATAARAGARLPLGAPDAARLGDGRGSCSRRSRASRAPAAPVRRAEGGAPLVTPAQ